MWLLIGVQNIFGQTITNFTPKSGPVGTSVSITGTGFNSTLTNNIVFFGATQASVTAANSTSLTVAVPAGAIFAPITVLNTSTGLTGFSNQFYNPTFTPNKGNIKNADIAAKVDFATGFSPYSVAIGDLNGDGKPELVTGNSANGPDVTVLRNTSSGGTISFATKVEFTTGGQPNSIAIADIDGDGKLDIATANPFTGNVSVLRNTSSSGSISFAAKVDFTVVGNCVAIAVSDINSDGKPDLLTVNKAGSSTVSVLRNTSTGSTITFAAKVDFATGANPQAIAIGDVDGDGKVDLAVANDGSGTVSLLRNTSSTTTISFATKVDFTTDVNPYSVSIGDIDGDNKLDLAVANYGFSSGGNNVSILRNTSSIGTINFATRVNYSTGTNPTSVSIGDINGDGKPDLAISNTGSNTVSIFHNRSDSGLISFSPKVDKTTGSNPYSVSIGDLSGDGKPDIAVANSNSSANSISVFRNNPIFPEIIVSGTLSTFSTCLGSASVQQNLNVRGRFLDSNILITAPTGFEISTNSVTGYQSNITLIRTLDSVPLTTIYVRLANTANGTPTGNISFTSIWAVTQNIGVSGLVKSLTSSTNNLSICPSQLPFTWNGLTFDSAGTKTKSSLVNSVGCDSSATLTLSLKSTSASTTNLSICPSQLPFTWNGLTFDSAGTKTKSGLVNAVGCDSSATLTLSLKPTSTSTTNLSICPSQLPFTWNGLTFDSAGTKTKSGLVNAVGCDSSATLTLSLKPTSISTTNLSICPGQLPFTWNGLTFDSAGTKTKSGLVNAFGCDSSATLILNLFPNPIVGVIIGPQIGLFTSTNYVYTVTQQLNANYNWTATNAVIVSGQGTNSINVQFTNAGSSVITSEIISNQGCRDTSSLTLNIGTVGINKIEANYEITAFPNPTDGQLNIIVDSRLLGSKYKLIDYTGRIVLTGFIEKENEIIQLSSLPNGIYLLNIGDSLRPNFKIIKQ
jgi:hypothetical protein